jgi:hypothetical protein
MLSSRARRPRLAVAVALGVAMAMTGLVACSGGGSDDASSSTTTVPTTAAPVTAAPVTTLPGQSDTCPDFRGVTTSLTSGGPTAPAFLVDAIAGAVGCLDVVTLTFQTRGDGTPPGYTVGYQDQSKQPFKDGDPPSDIEVPGAATLAVTVAPAASTDTSVPDSPQQTYTGNLSLDYGDHHHLVIVRELPDGKDPAGQDTVNWVIGLDSVRPFRVDRAANPPRVMILIG